MRLRIRSAFPWTGYTPRLCLGKCWLGKPRSFSPSRKTYMNLCVESAGPLAAYYKLPLNWVVLIFDDTNLPCGVLRLHGKGGPGGHNGLKSVMHHFRGNREFPRLRIGIGRPPGQMDPKAFLLQKFNATAQERIDTALQGVELLKFLIDKSFTEAAKCFNTRQKYKHLRLQTTEVLFFKQLFQEPVWTN